MQTCDRRTTSTAVLPFSHSPDFRRATTKGGHLQPPHAPASMTESKRACHLPQTQTCGEVRPQGVAASRRRRRRRSRSSSLSPPAPQPQPAAPARPRARLAAWPPALAVASRAPALAGASGSAPLRAVGPPLAAEMTRHHCPAAHCPPVFPPGWLPSVNRCQSHSAPPPRPPPQRRSEAAAPGCPNQGQSLLRRGPSLRLRRQAPQHLRRRRSPAATALSATAQCPSQWVQPESGRPTLRPESPR